MGALDIGLDTLFRSELAIDALYVPLSGSAFSVRAILRAPDVETNLLHGNKMQQQSTVFEIRRSELATPASGARLLVSNVGYRITSVSTKDPRRAVWSLEAATDR